jgi:hypothetical protein
MRRDAPIDRLLRFTGGVSGLVATVAPVVAFTATVGFGVLAAVGIAICTAGAVLMWCLWRGGNVRPAVLGLAGVAGQAAITLLTGDARDFFVVHIWKSLLWAVVLFASVVLQRPLVGVLWAWSVKGGDQWRRTRQTRLAFGAATVVWSAVFLARFVVEHSLYRADEVVQLGLVRLAMGWPLTALVSAATYVAIRRARRHLNALESAVLTPTN